MADAASAVCLRCGLSSCRGAHADWARAEGACTTRYSAADLALAVCFVCGRRGHLCCASTPSATYRCHAGLRAWRQLTLPFPCGCAVGCDSAVSRSPTSAAHIRRHVISMMINMCAPMLRRPSCYYCGEGGHTAAECNQEKPIAVRNERQPGYSERSVAASYYGYGDDYGGAQGCVAPAAWLSADVSSSVAITVLHSCLCTLTWTVMCGCVSTDTATVVLVAAAVVASHAIPVASQGTWPGTAQIDAAGRRTTAEADLQQRTAAAAGGKHSCLPGSMTDDDALTWSMFITA